MKRKPDTAPAVGQRAITSFFAPRVQPSATQQKPRDVQATAAVNDAFSVAAEPLADRCPPESAAALSPAAAAAADPPAPPASEDPMDTGYRSLQPSSQRPAASPPAPASAAVPAPGEEPTGAPGCDGGSSPPPSSREPDQDQEMAEQQEGGEEEEEEEEEGNGENAYERERQERIRRNQEVMRSLGLGAPVISPRRKPPRPAPAKRAPRPPPAPVEVRRSGRSRGPPAGSDAGAEAGAWELPAAAPPAPQEPLVFDDSSVLRYVCDAPSAGGAGGEEAEGRPAGAAIVGFSQLPQYLHDPALARAYSVDWRPGLVVAGGKDGQVSVFGSREAERRGGGGGPAPDDGAIAPLISHRLHKGWISDVQFLSADSGSSGSSSGSGGGGLRLLTAGNDGEVSLWDLGRSAEVARGAVPLRLARGAGLHSGGVFSMHERGGRVLTASKDGTVALAAVGGEGAIALVRSYDDLHCGVVKCARWRGGSGAEGGAPTTFASCGNDQQICVVDTREGGSGAGLTLGGHRTAVNSLRWHPSSEHLLLSCSHDPHILLHDLRSPAEPLFAFAGHSQERRLKGIYQPAFVAGGDAIATGGERSDLLSLYCTRTGATISRGGVGIQIGATTCGSGPSDPLIVTTTRACHLFAPRWKQAAGEAA